MVKEKRRGIIFKFFTLWAVLVFLCNLAIEHRVFRPIVAVKSWEELMLILSLPTLAVSLVIVVRIWVKFIDDSLCS